MVQSSFKRFCLEGSVRWSRGELFVDGADTKQGQAEQTQRTNQSESYNRLEEAKNEYRI